MLESTSCMSSLKKKKKRRSFTSFKLSPAFTFFVFQQTLWKEPSLNFYIIYIITLMIIKPLLSGFIPYMPTTNTLTVLYDTFCQALDAGKEVRVVFCDISKVFDQVWHKLYAAWVLGSLLRWFNSYLTN